MFLAAQRFTTTLQEVFRLGYNKGQGMLLILVSMPMGFGSMEMLISQLTVIQLPLTI